MSISTQALWLLCGVGAVVFSTGLADLRRITGIALGFALTAWLLRGGLVADPATLAGLAVLVAGCRIYRPAWTLLPAFCGGLLAAVLGSLLVAQGLMPWVAFPAAAVIPILSLVLATRNRVFAPEPLVEEGVLLVLALGLGAAVGPQLLDGWRSAGALNVAADAATLSMPAWVLLVAAASTFVGGAWSLWRHR